MFVYYFSVLSCFFATFLKDKKIKVHDQERSENADEDRSRTWFYR